MYRAATPSPLLPQSPSLFERYPRPKKKLKQLHWEKIEDTGNSIWKDAKAEKYADDLYERGVLAQLEKAFAAREIKLLANRRKEDLNKVTFLSRDVSQQFGINLHMYAALSVKEVVHKILRCEKDFLGSASVIDFLLKPEIVEVSNNLARNFAPYSTEWEGVSSVDEAKTPEKDPGELQRADQLYLEMMVNLQGYWASRMRALKVITTYEKEYSDLLTKLRSIDKAVSSIQHSENLRSVFEVILAVGNYMNDSSKQAHGFKLATLQRLTFIKDEKNSMTFLNYVEKIIRENYAEFNGFLQELEPVLDVVKISVEQLAADCREFSQNVVNVERSIEVGNLSDSSKFHPWDRVLVKVLPVLPEARKRSDLLSDEVKLTLMEFDGLMQMFGEDASDKFAKNSFFKKFADFIQEYKKAQAHNIKMEEEERAYERRKKMVEEQHKRARLEAEKRGVDDGSEAEGVPAVSRGERDVMDKLLEKLKNAGPGKSDPSSARKRALARKKLLDGKRSSANILDNFELDEAAPVNQSLVYSPEATLKAANAAHAESPTPKASRQGSVAGSGATATPLLESPTKQASAGPEDVADRARNLLKELRGPESEKRKPLLEDHREKMRARRRRVNEGASSENKLVFVGEAAEAPTDSPKELPNDTTADIPATPVSADDEPGSGRADDHDQALNAQEKGGSARDSDGDSDGSEFVDA